MRLSPTGKNNLLFTINFTPVDRPDYRVGVPKKGNYRLIMDETGKVEPKVFKAEEGECDNRPFSVAYPLKPFGIGVFRF